MLLPFRKLLPVLLAVLFCWQGFAVAHHKGEHHHTQKVDHECAVCVLGMPAIEFGAALVPVSHSTASVQPNIGSSLLSTVSITQNARSPPKLLI